MATNNNTNDLAILTKMLTINGVLEEGSPPDKAFLNYLNFQKYDPSYIPQDECKAYTSNGD